MTGHRSPESAYIDIFALSSNEFTSCFVKSLLIIYIYIYIYIYTYENSFSRWIIEKSDGLTTLGLQKLSETVRDYTYLISTSQTSMRGPIVGHEA